MPALRDSSLVLSILCLAPALASAEHAETTLAPPRALAAATDATPPSVQTRRGLSVGIDPIGLVTGTYALSIAQQVAEHVALRADAQFVTGVAGVPDSFSWRAGFTVPIYLGSAFRGPFIEPGLVAARTLVGLGLTAPNDPMPPSIHAVHDVTLGPQVFVGWHWMVRTGLNISGAIGASGRWLGSGPPGIAGVSPGTGALGGLSARTGPESYLRVGYAF